MATILFDITVETDAAALVNSHLVMEISPRVFSYAVVNRHAALQQLRCYALDTTNHNHLLDELQGIITTDTLLNTSIEKKTFVYNFPESQLVPEQYFSLEAAPHLMDLMHGDLNKGIILSERIQHTDKYNVFRIPAGIHSLFQRHFTNAKYWHYYSLWMQYQHETGTTSMPDFISAVFYPNRILATVVRDKQVQLVQSYNYEAAEDVAYYLLNMCRQFQLSPAETPLILSGMLDTASVLYTEIFKYFAKTSMEPLPGIADVPALKDYPAHFFSPLLKLALCAS